MATDDMFDFVNDSFNKYVSDPTSASSSSSVSLKADSISSKLMNDSKTGTGMDHNTTAPTTACTTDDTNGFSDEDKPKSVDNEVISKTHIEQQDAVVDDMLRLVNDALSKLKTSVVETGILIKERETKINSKAAPHTNSNPPQRGGLYKTVLCKHYQESVICPFGSGCWFAHGTTELRPMSVRTGSIANSSRTGSVANTPTPSPSHSFMKKNSSSRAWSMSNNWRA